MQILNFGSLNLDYIYQVPHFLSPGETLAATEQHIVPGGKGLNQSVALARAGAQVFHAGVIGLGGGQLKDVLTESGVNISLLEEKNVLQGNAIIQVNSTGENCILLFGGSNRSIDCEQVHRTLESFGPGDILILQNEVSCLKQMVETALDKKMQIILNPSPFDDSLTELPLGRLSWIFINEVEGRQLTGEEKAEDILAKIRCRYPDLKVVLTLGKEGSCCAVPGEEVIRQPIFPVQAVDTTAAGDTFTGYFIAAYAQGRPLSECMRRAAAASAISVSRIGSSVSIPYAEEVARLLTTGEMLSRPS